MSFLSGNESSVQFANWLLLAQNETYETEKCMPRWMDTTFTGETKDHLLLVKLWKLF